MWPVQHFADRPSSALRIARIKIETCSAGNRRDIPESRLHARRKLRQARRDAAVASNRAIAMWGVALSELHTSKTSLLAVSRLRHLVRRRPISPLVQIDQPLTDKALAPLGIAFAKNAARQIDTAPGDPTEPLHEGREKENRADHGEGTRACAAVMRVTRRYMRGNDNSCRCTAAAAHVPLSEKQ